MCDWIADALDGAHRLGANQDIPEGSRWIELSDTLARKISGALRAEHPADLTRVEEVQPGHFIHIMHCSRCGLSHNETCESAKSGGIP